MADDEIQQEADHMEATDVTAVEEGSETHGGDHEFSKGDDKEIDEVETPPVIEAEKETNKENEQGTGADLDSDDDYQLFAKAGAGDKEETSSEVIAQNELIEKSTPTTALEKALASALKRKESHIERITKEINKLKTFVSKRKQTYKRKRKEEGAPTRALSAYNIFIQDRFARLAKENEKALKSDDTDAQLQRVPPSNLVASTGNAWKELPPELKSQYEERARTDRKRYEEEMAAYQPPDNKTNKKRNKTGYNMFFSAHVMRLKQTETGVPSERGSVARLVGSAWKQLTPEEKQFYEREADKHNGMNPMLKEGEEEDEEEEIKRQQMEHYHMQAAAAAHGEMHMHPGMPMHPPMQHPHDPRHHGYYPPHMYAQPTYAHYDYSQHHRHQQARAQGYNQAYPPPRHAYEPGAM